MKTCGDCLFFCDPDLCVKYDQLEAYDWDSPACATFELDPDALMDAARTSIDKAHVRHPDFAYILRDAAEDYADKAADLKADSTLHAVLVAECYEFLVEMAKGDFARAKQEAGDVIAVLYRALNGEGRPL